MTKLPTGKVSASVLPALVQLALFILTSFILDSTGDMSSCVNVDSLIGYIDEDLLGYVSSHVFDVSMVLGIISYKESGELFTAYYVEVYAKSEQTYIH